MTTQAVPPAQQAAPPQSVTSPPPAASPPPLLETALQAGKQWVATAPANRWFLQLFAVEASQPQQAEAFLRQAKEAGLDMDQTRAYLSDLSGKMRYGIIYGDFGTANEGREIIGQLPAFIRAKHPFPRPIKQLH